MSNINVFANLESILPSYDGGPSILEFWKSPPEPTTKYFVFSLKDLLLNSIASLGEL